MSPLLFLLWYLFADCPSKCLNQKLLGNGICNIECFVSDCDFDQGDCPTCAIGCHLDFLTDQICTLECDNAECNYDNLICNTQNACHCNPDLIGDGICNEDCLTIECLNDLDDCGQCNPGCDFTMLANNLCDSNCQVLKCGMDMNDCNQCTKECQYLKNNGICDQQCNYIGCKFDDCHCAEGCPQNYLSNGICDSACIAPCDDDCQEEVCSFGCYVSMIGNGTCNRECLNQKCQFDGGDCNGCSNKCGDQLLGDGYCDFNCFNTQCDFDRGDCVSIPGQCAEYCEKEMIDNQICDEFCNTSECDFDGFDCVAECSQGCLTYYLSNGICDEQCNNVNCKFDYGDCGCTQECIELEGNNICDSQCNNKFCNYDECECSPGCDQSYLGNGFCDQLCNTNNCEFDKGDCNYEKYCYNQCEFSMLGDGECQTQCNNAKCNFDYGDCQWECSTNCPDEFIGNGVCNPECNTSNCSNDGGDCSSECSAGCFVEQSGNGICELECLNNDCNQDGGDCVFLEDCQCDTSILGNGTCDLQCYLEKCNYDFGDCYKKNCNFNCQSQFYLGNGICDRDCNTYLCNYDDGDCQNCPTQCDQLTEDGVCQSACYNLQCQLDASDCQNSLCNIGCFDDYLGNGFCDPQCNNSKCNFDNGDCDGFYCSLNCTIDMIGDGKCDSECFNQSCLFDLHDCSKKCQERCPIKFIGDSQCNIECYNPICNYDGGDCINDGNYCSQNCPNTIIGDGNCNSHCNIEECSYDGGDCDAFCNDYCPLVYLDNGNCDPVCYNCNYDGKDCDVILECSEGCLFEQIGDGECQNQCFNESCLFDLHDCEKCSENCFVNWIGNGVCQDDCYLKECYYDGGDCDCQDGEYYNQQECIVCQENCLVCNIEGCLQCEIGISQLVDGKCQCQAGFWYDMQQCQKCIDNCKICENNQECIECDEQFYTDEQKQCQECEAGCQICDTNGCIKCINGDNLQTCLCNEGSWLDQDTGLCENCSNLCEVCDSPENCIQCKETFEINEGDCICPRGTWLNSDVCTKCDDFCSQCSGTLQCEQCVDDYQLIDGECIAQCSEGFVQDPQNLKQCVACSNYFTLDEISINYMESFQGFDVYFSQNVDISRIKSCSDAFQDFEQKLGINPICKFIGQKQYQVIFGPNPSIDYEQNIQLNSKQFAQEKNDCKKLFDLKIQPAFPQERPKPIAIIQAPQVFSKRCSANLLTISGSSSQGHLTRILLYKWQITQSNGQQIKGYDQFSSQNGIMTINNIDLVSGKLQIVLTVKNALGETDQTNKIIQIEERNIIPVQLQGPSNVTLYDQSSLNLFLDAEACDQGQMFQYNWLLKSGNQNDQIVSQNHILKLRSSLLVPNQQYTYLAYFNQQLMQEIKVMSLLYPLVIILDTDNRTVLQGDSIIIDASQSYDPNMFDGQIQFEWSCVDQHGNCTDLYGDQLINVSNEPVLKIGDKLSKLDSVYKFTVKISKQDRLSVKSIEIRVVPGQDANLYLPRINSVISDQSELSIVSIATSNYDAEFLWEQVEGPAITEHYPENQHFIYFNRKSFKEGKNYKFKLTMNFDTFVLISWIGWYVPYNPVKGQLQVNPKQGSFETEFLLNCSNFYSIRSKEQLIYQYFIDSNGYLQAISMPKAIDYLWTQLKVGNYNLYVKVCDKDQVCIWQNTEVIVTQSGKRLQHQNILEQYNKETTNPENVLPLTIFYCENYILDASTFDLIYEKFFNYFKTFEKLSDGMVDAMVGGITSMLQQVDVIDDERLSNINYHLQQQLQNDISEQQLHALLDKLLPFKQLLPLSSNIFIEWTISQYMKNKNPGQGTSFNTKDSQVIIRRVFQKDLKNLKIEYMETLLNLPNYFDLEELGFIYDLLLTITNGQKVQLTPKLVGYKESYQIIYYEQQREKYFYYKDNPINLTIENQQNFSDNVNCCDLNSCQTEYCKIISIDSNLIKLQLFRTGAYIITDQPYYAPEPYIVPQNQKDKDCDYYYIIIISLARIAFTFILMSIIGFIFDKIAKNYKRIGKKGVVPNPEKYGHKSQVPDNSINSQAEVQNEQMHIADISQIQNNGWNKFSRKQVIQAQNVDDISSMSFSSDLSEDTNLIKAFTMPKTQDNEEENKISKFKQFFVSFKQSHHLFFSYFIYQAQIKRTQKAELIHIFQLLNLTAMFFFYVVISQDPIPNRVSQPLSLIDYLQIIAVNLSLLPYKYLILYLYNPLFKSSSFKLSLKFILRIANIIGTLTILAILYTDFCYTGTITEDYFMLGSHIFDLLITQNIICLIFYCKFKKGIN